ncbi:DUF6265 family protein [Flavobacterium sp. XGLA_31]|uniref:DUF6265 family protein n=1 Tax=Flavobacterium sp. XGLA_31 TaxID=3447666 RepID=UPI003F3511AA
MKSKIVILISTTVMAACLISCQKKSHKKFDKIEKLSWLIGSWEQKMPEGLLAENWKKENDSTFTGNTYFINSKDTVHFESIQLVQKDDELIYSATVTGQNNDKAVDFKLTSEVQNTFTFENPAHDYPQKIAYKKVNENNLIAMISGKQQGKESKESYPMQRK